MFASCNDDDTTDYGTIVNTTVTNVEVTEFSLSANTKIAENLDSLFFSIDLDNARIFNADSLPVGTKRGKAVVNITLPTVSKAELLFTSDGEQKTVDFLTNATDSVDFTSNDVKLRVISADESVTREYSISLNVHEVSPDTLTWGLILNRSLSSLANPTESKTILVDKVFYTLTTDGTSSVITYNNNPESESNTEYSTTLPAGADVTTFAALDGSLYLVASSQLYKAQPNSAAWTSTGVAADYIYGVYDGELMCARRNADGSYSSVRYPSLTETDLPKDCPVKNTSGSCLYSSQWSYLPLLTVTGGRMANGKVTGATWAYDGNSWANISISPLPALEGIIVVEYYSILTNNQWMTETSPVLLAFGGVSENGTGNRTVYMSRDRGVHWATGPEYMQSSAVPDYNTASVFTFEQTLYPADASRAVRPIESWVCPYIYVYGGHRPGGRLVNTVYRGVINYFTLLPIQ